MVWWSISNTLNPINVVTIPQIIVTLFTQEEGGQAHTHVHTHKPHTHTYIKARIPSRTLTFHRRRDLMYENI